MKKLLLAILLPFLCPAYPDQSPQERYIDQWSSTAVAEMKRSGVPASITLAQGLLESNAGQSSLATKANNHFGIKCHNTWKGKRTYADDDARNECFRVYPSAEESFRDHSDFLRYQDRYKKLFELDPTDYKAWSKGLKKAGYATDPKYASKLIRLIEDYELYRFDLDRDNSAVDVPQAPVELESPRDSRTGRIASASTNEYLNVSFARKELKQNGVRFIYSLEGESYSSIATSRKLFLKEILSFNDADSDAVLAPGTVVYLERKKKQAAKGVDKFIVGPQKQTLREIAQRFGVREKSLRKINGFADGFEPDEGDTVLLR